MHSKALKVLSKHLNSTQPTAANNGAWWRHLSVLDFTTHLGQVCSTRLASAHFTQQQLLSTRISQRPL